jgi:hypothetical protein
MVGARSACPILGRSAANGGMHLRLKPSFRGGAPSSSLEECSRRKFRSMNNPGLVRAAACRRLGAKGWITISASSLFLLFLSNAESRFWNATAAVGFLTKREDLKRISFTLNLPGDAPGAGNSSLPISNIVLTADTRYFKMPKIH